MFLDADDLPASCTSRAACESDRDWYADLSLLVLGPYGRTLFGLDDDTMRQGLHDEFEPAVTTVVERSGTRVALMAVMQRDDHVWLDHMIVEPSWQGRGIGTALVRSVQSHARSLDLPLELSVVDTNPAHVLYERLGFTISGRIPPRTRFRWYSGHG